MTETTKQETQTLHARLEQKQRELDLILAIDRIRDTALTPSGLLTAIANLLADRFRADLCLLCLLDRETGELELKAATSRGEQWGRWEPVISRDLAKRAVKADDIVVWDGSEMMAASGQTRPIEDLQMVAVPIVLGAEERLGALLLARPRIPFGAREVDLLKIAESQIDSAVVQGYAWHDLQQRNKELETIYRVDHIRDQQLPFDEMLNRVLQELCTAIQAEMGFIMLYSRTARRLDLRATTHDDLFRVSPHCDEINRVANEALHQAEMVCYNNLGDVLRSILCIPLVLGDEIIGVLGVANRYGPSGFRSEDRRLMRAIGSQMDTAIFESMARRRLRQVLGRSVDPHVMERLLADPDVGFLEGERLELSVLYADLRGSTRLSERTPPELLVGFINDYLGRMTQVILSHEGTLDKFVGDEVMALFGAPFPQPDHALRAVRVGLEMQIAHHGVMETWRARGIDPTPIGIGIASGEMTVGEFGCLQRTDYTAIGPAANLGARLCSAARPGQVLISQATYDCVRDRVESTPVSGLELKGMPRDISVYEISRVLE